MGNYSRLLFISDNADKVTIDWSRIDKSLLEKGYPYIDSFNCLNVLNILNILNILTLEDLGNILDDHKFFGYWDNDTEKKLIAINKALTPYGNSSPRLYFEEEGWDRVHFIEFHPGTDDIYHGVKIFDIVHNEEPDNVSDEWYKLENARIKNLTLNVAKNPCDWVVRKVIITAPPTALQTNLSILLLIRGLRYEDVIKDPKLFGELSKIATNMGNNVVKPPH